MQEDDLLIPASDPLGSKRSGGLAPPKSAADTESVGLTQFLDSVGQVLRHSHGMPQWVQCEVAFLQAKSKGYWVLGLQETDDQGRKKASAEALVWSNDADRILGVFERVTGQPLAVGMRVLLRVELTFSSQWGLRLVAKGIDPRWTLGEAAAAQNQLRQTLQREGQWDLNRRLSSPADFTRLAVLSPDGSAGVEDFLKETQRLEKHGLCELVLFHAPFEGDNAPRSLPSAFSAIAAAGPFDAVCVIRGGGAASGIAWLNHEAIVRAAVACPYPLITGIGHERDSTLLDEVAHTAKGTPSKAAEHIVQTIVEKARKAERAWEDLVQQTHYRLDTANARSDQLFESIFQQAKARLDHQSSQVDSLFRECIGLGPHSTLQRGYALVQDDQQRLVTSAKQAQMLSQLTVRFSDGALVVSPQPRTEP